MEQIIAIIMGVSLANERLLEILKTYIPWLANEFESVDNRKKPLQKERVRKVTIQLITIFTGWVTASFFASDGSWSLELLFTGKLEHIPVAIIGILASAGSAFWNQIFGYSKAIKEAKRQLVADEQSRMHVAKRKNNYQAAHLEFLKKSQPTI